MATTKKSTKKTPAAKTAKNAPKAEKKAPVKKAPVKTDDRRKSCGLPPAERRERFVRSLKKLRAVTPTSAVTSKEISKADGKLTPFDCYCAGYHKNELATSGVVKSCTVEGKRGLCYYAAKKAK